MINSKELLINMERTPDENSQEFFDFWKLERDKCKHGLTIDNVYISGFLYYHLNFFKCQIDILDNGRIIRKLSNPYLRDNEWIIDTHIREAEKQQKGLCVLGSRRLAKALRNDELLYTERGTIQIGNAKVGDRIYSPDGKLTSITGVFPQGSIDIYKFALEDGRTIHCCENHIWQVYDKRKKQLKNLTTKELMPIYKSKRIHNGYKDKITRDIEECYFAIPNNKALDFEQSDLPLNPYFLGLWLGDGHSRNTGVTTIDTEIVQFLEDYSKLLNLNLRKDGDSYHITSGIKGGDKREFANKNYLFSKLKDLNLIKNKHIPNIYLYSSFEQRLSLLQGLMDTDGSCTTKDGVITFVTTCKKLSEDFYFLCRSLGINLKKKQFIPKLYGKECGIGWKFSLYTELPIFRLSRKLSNLRIGVKGKQFKINYTSIKNIELVGKDEATCITVDNDSKLFLTTNLTTTHNSVVEASYTSHRATFFKGTQNVIGGLNEPDIKIITDLIEEALVGLPIAFKKGRIEDNWKKQVTLGEKTASGERIPWSSIAIRNLDEGRNTEALAGLSPFSMVIDEIGKGNWLDCFSAAIPGFATPFGWRCSPLAFGTSGDMQKAQDARKVFESPDAYNFLAVEVPDEPGTKRSVFISGHYAHDFPKDVKPLNEYLKIPKEDTPNLSKFDIQITNHQKAEKMIDAEREQAKQAEGASALLKITMYHPKNIRELFLTSSNNNFPIEEIEMHKLQLETYKPTYIEFYRDSNNKVVFQHSDLEPIMKYPVKSTEFKDAPVCITEFPQDDVPFGTYCIGIDPYNEDTSSQKYNSLGSIYVYKRMYNPLGEFQNSIVAWWAGRKKTVKEFHELCLQIAEFYNAISSVLPENEDKTLIQYFFHKKKGHFLADSFELAKQINPLTKTNRLKGLSASTVNQRHYMNLMYAETKDDISTVNEQGEEVTQMGVYKIPDTMLLEEMVQYRGKPTGSKGVHDINCDRICAFGHCLTLAKYYDYKYPSGSWKAPAEEENEIKKLKRQKTPFGYVTKGLPSPFIKNKIKHPINRTFI